jgi:hypothetical protein
MDFKKLLREVQHKCDILYRIVCAINNSVSKSRTNHDGPWLGYGLTPREELRQVVNVLNCAEIFEEVVNEEEFGDYETTLRNTPPILRDIVQRWQMSGPDPVKFHRDNPSTWVDADSYLKANPPGLWCMRSGGVGLIQSPFPGRTPYEKALRFFLMLITNPAWKKLGGPCAACGEYYIRRTARNSTYCKRSCATRTTAIRATRKKRDNERTEKVQKATRFIQEWRSARTKLDWKHWVARRDPELTLHWLTRAVNNGDLIAPGALRSIRMRNA